MKKIILLLLSTELIGCGYFPSYEGFVDSNNRFVKEKINSMPYYVKKNIYLPAKEYSVSEYIYIYTYDNYDDGQGCVYGFITDKDDPKQRAKDWVVLSGKEFCARPKYSGII